jgi:hypothetical protein
LNVTVYQNPLTVSRRTSSFDLLFFCSESQASTAFSAMKVLLKYVRNGTATTVIANDDMRLSLDEMRQWRDRMNQYLAHTGADKKGSLYYLA